MMIVGYIWACVAASLVLTLGTLAPNWDDLDALGHSLGEPSDGVPAVALWSVVGIGAVIVFAVGFFPTLLAIILTEGFRLRSIIVYALIGAGARACGGLWARFRRLCPCAQCRYDP